MQGVSGDETVDIISGKQDFKVTVPHSLRSALCSIGLGDMLAPVNIFTIAGDTEAILLSETWKDIEFEVALDSGSVVRVCSLDDVPGYKLSESPGSRRGQDFLMGDCGTFPNLGQSQLNLSDCNVGRGIQSVFQIAAVTRLLMSVGRICDEGHSVTLNDVMAVVHDKEGGEICRFHKNLGRAIRR